MLETILIIILGVLGASNLIIAKQPNAKGLIDKLQPIQGWLGVVSFVWGIWLVIQGVLNISALSSFLILMIQYFATAGCVLVLGFLLGLGILESFTKSPEKKLKLEKLASTLSPWQGILGLLCIGLGVWGLLSQLGVV